MKEPSIKKNTLLSLFISGIGYLYPIIVFIYIARILHPEGLGSVRFASSVAAYFVMFTGLGMPIYGMRAVAGASQDELSGLTAELFLIRLLTGILAWAVSLLTIGFRPENDLLLIFLLMTLFAIPNVTWIYQGKAEYSVLP